MTAEVLTLHDDQSQTIGLVLGRDPRRPKNVSAKTTTRADFVAMLQARTTERQDGAYYVLGRLRGKRSDENLYGIEGLALDFDDLSPDSLAALFVALEGRAGVMHSTRHHSEGSPRIRVILWGSRLFEVGEHKTLWRMFARELSRFGVDKNASAPSQPMFWPGPCPGGCGKDIDHSAARGEQWVRVLDGEDFDVDGMLERAAIQAEPVETISEPGPAAAPTGSDEARVRGMLRAACDAIRATPKGERNETMAAKAYDIGGWIHLGAFTIEEAETALMAAAHEGGWDQTYEGHRRTCRRQLEVGAQHPRELPPSAMASVTEDKSETGWERDGPSEIFAPLPPIQWVCEGLEIAPGAPTMVAGYGYSGKTLFVQDLALAVAVGGDVGGAWPAVQGRVVHLDYEQGRRLTFERYQRLARARGVDAAKVAGRMSVVTFPADRIDDEDAEQRFVRELEGHALAVIDCYRAAAPRTDENSSEARVPLDTLSRVSERTGCAVVVVHHARKTNDADSDGRQILRGSSALFDACQSVWTMTAQKGEPALLQVAKARLTGREGRYVCRVEDVAQGDPRWGLEVRVEDANEFDVERRTRQADKLMDGVLAVVRENPGRSTNGIESACRRAGLRARTTRIRAALEELQHGGAIRNRNEGTSKKTEWYPLGPGGERTW